MPDTMFAVSKRVALLALVPLMYSIFRHEMEALLEGKHSTYVHPKKARALKVNKAPDGEPGMAMSYLYQPGTSMHIRQSTANPAKMAKV
jgi:hypothetical protein